MGKKYTSIINKDNQPLYIKDKEAQLKIETIEENLIKTFHYIGKSESEIGLSAKGPWYINSKYYNVLYFEHLFTGGAPALYIRNKELDLDINSEHYYAYNLTNYPSSAGQDLVLYIKENILNGHNIIYKIDAGHVIEIPGYNFYTFHNIESEEINLDFYSVVSYKPDTYNSKEIKYSFGPTGWSDFGSSSKDAKIIFPSMEFEPNSGELVITDENIEDNFDFDYSTGELIFNP